MLEPERLTLVQWFLVCLVFVIAIFYICCWIDTNYQL
jgi:hypothetical protein